MTTVSIAEAQAALDTLLAGLAPGDELVITKNNLPIGRLIRVADASITPRPIRKLGTLAGTVTHITPDFDAPLDDFSEYSQ